MNNRVSFFVGLVSFFCGWFFFSVVCVSAEVVKLKRGEINVIGDKLKLGDIFSGLSKEKSNTIVGDAPRPGKSYTLYNKQLIHINQYYDVRWLPDDGVKNIVVKRVSRVIDRDMVVKSLLKKIGVDGDISVMLSDFAEIHVPVDRSVDDITFKEFQWLQDEKSFADYGVRKFVTIISISGGDVERVVHGSISRMVEVPVLSRLMKPGEIISNSDIEMKKVAQARINRSVIHDINSLVGMAIKNRVVVKGEPLSMHQVEKPVMVKRGSVVRVVASSPNMSITMQGRAIRDGRLGDVIDIENVKSKSIIQAKVTGYGKASMDIAVVTR